METVDHHMFEEHARNLKQLANLTQIVEQHLRAGKYGKPGADDELEGNEVTDLHALVRHARKMTE